MRKSVLDALFPKTRQSILSTLLLSPEKWWYLSDLAGHLGVSPSSLQRELAALTQSHLLDAKKDGNRVYYKANPDWICYPELSALFIKTSGVVEVIKRLLGKFQKEADFVFIYGSLARGEAGSESDIDLMIIGRLKTSSIASAIKDAESQLGREINITQYSTEEFAKKIDDENSFVATVLEGKKIFIIGSENELKNLAK